MIKCFVINLDHRKDRLKRIRKHLNSNGLYFTRFQAVNALETNSKILTKNILKYGPLGKISIGDNNIQTYTIQSIRKSISYVQQEVFLFSDTILNNVKMYDETIDDNTVENAAIEIGIHDFISSLPNSYEYVVGERGITLSVGQRQLIAFLRAYIRNPKIIILDEATSSIDSESEELLQAALKKMSINRTIIIIAHRLSTITGADKILLLDKGNIIESGDHKSLIDQKGKYFEMFNKQKNIELY